MISLDRYLKDHGMKRIQGNLPWKEGPGGVLCWGENNTHVYAHKSLVGQPRVARRGNLLSTAP